MKARDVAVCARCKPRAVCFPQVVSRLEARFGHETFKCESCGRVYKVVPNEDVEIEE